LLIAKTFRKKNRKKVHFLYLFPYLCKKIQAFLMA